MSSVNPYLPHIMVLPEDQANEEIANGFQLHFGIVYSRIRVLAPSRGWMKVVDDFHSEWESTLYKYPARFFVLVFDLDHDVERADEVKRGINPDLADRVFVLGTLTEPEDLGRQFGSFEAIGARLAADCSDDTMVTWGHPLLIHNLIEANRLRTAVASFVFCKPNT